MARIINRSGRALVLVALAATTLGLGGCAGDKQPTAGVYAPEKSDLLGQATLSDAVPVTYQLGVNDSIQIKVFGEPELSFDRVLINQAGNFNMAFLGDVHAAGLTVTDLTTRVRAELGKHLVNPQVSINLVGYGSQRITVEGSVVHPGIFELVPGTTLLGALATAGDPDRFARVKSIAIIRTDEKGRLLAVVDLHAVRAGKMIDPVLQANDHIVVGVSGGSRFYQDMIGLIPAAVIFSRI
jgi:polysaccharide export outer membrane protein